MENNFCKNLKRIRMDKNIIQSELAEKLNVKQVTISSWESGRTEPSMGDTARLADALGCTQEELIGIKRNTGDISYEDLIVKVSTLDIDELGKLADVVNRQLSLRIEIDRLERKKAEQEKAIMEYARKIEELKRNNQ